MTAPPDDTTTDLHAVIAALRAERDAALAEKVAFAEALAARNSEFGERIEQQAATVDVLKIMSASPGDARPVFELIVERARSFCGADHATAALLQDDMLHLQAYRGMSAAYGADYEAQFPRPVDMSTMFGRAILSREVMQTGDLRAERDHFARQMHTADFHSIVAVPILREGTPIGAIALGRKASGGFSDSQIELLKTFAEQGVIAITSAETYRALQERTYDLMKSLENQTATSDVLKVISRSTFDLHPVLDTVVETAARLCNADMAAIGRPVGDLWRLVANFGFPPEFEGEMRARGAYPLDPDSPTVAGRAVRERCAVHIHDAAAIPGYPDTSIRLGKQRTSLGVPLLREGEVIGHIVLARQRVEPFTDQQIELVRTFADQAVIAIENTRLMNEQREALEQQKASADILAVISTSLGKVQPVFDKILESCRLLFGGDELDVLLVDEQGQLHVAAYLGKFRDAVMATFPAPVDITPAGPAIRERRVAHYPDVINNPDTPRVLRRMGEICGYHSVAFAPMLWSGRGIGAVGVARSRGAFTEREMAVLQSFAGQAVIAIENARLITEQREALEQQTATAEVLQVINASPGNLVPVFDAMLEKALRLCDANFGMFWQRDGESFYPAALHGVPKAFADHLMRNPLRPSPNSGLGRTAEGEPFVHTTDIADSDAYRSGDPQRRALVDLGGGRTALWVSLRKDGRVPGVFTIYRKEVRPFTDKQIALLQNFAAQAVIAMENARLLNEQQEALEQQTATAEVLQVINASPGNLTPVFEAILEKAHRICGAAIGSLILYDGECLRAAATHGFTEEFAALMRQPFRPSGRYQRLIDGERFVQAMPGDAISLRQAEVTGVRTTLAVPLRKDGVFLGAITAHRTDVRPFDEKEIVLLENFSAQAVIAMENARLITEQREALEQQTATAEVLQVINASPGNLTPVFDAILEKARILCEATYGGLMLRDEEGFRIVAARGAAPFVEAWRQLGPIRPPPGAWSERLIRGDTTVVHVIDVRADDIYSTLPTEIRQLYELGGIRTYLVAPLRKDDTILGLIILFRQEVRPFTDKQIALLQNFAAQAVIALENARLLDEIRQRQAELRTTFDNMGDGVAMFDTDLRLAAWNRNFQRIIDLPDTLLETRPGYADYLRLLAERGEFGTTDIEAELSLRIEDTDKELRLERVRPDGRVIEVRRNAVSGGGFVLIYSDITERKRSEEEIRAARDAAETALRELRTAQANLIQAEKMASLGQLTAGIAHEIKNPLNFVNNFAALSVDLLAELKDTAAPGFAALTEKQRAEVEEVSVMLTSNLEKITEHGKRADGIVKAMLEHSRGSSGERRMVDLNALIDEALNLAYHGARAQDQSFNVTLERDFGAGIAPVEVNPQDITRVFLNIFSNGFYATTRRARDGGDAGFEPTLRVTTRDAGEAVEIRVRDNGTGIPADIRNKLFQPFFTTKPTGEGTGLGLSITYDIVTQQHGGNIAVESKVGDYSEFTIRLPRTP